VDFVVLNYASSGQTQVTANQIETMIPPHVWNELSKDDNQPYFSVEAIKYPVIGNTHIPGTPGTYEESYFNSLKESVKKAPIPGSKDGHSDSSKPSNDLFTVGVRVDSNGNGTGTAYFKNYIPPMGFETSNFGLIRDAKIGLLRFSLVSKPVYEITAGANGMSEYHIVGTKGGDRNDAVEEGAMHQTVNSKNAAGDVDAFRNFHSARVRDPADFKQDGRWANTTIDKTKGIQLVTGQLLNPPKGQEGSLVAQAYRFPIDKFSPSEVRKWMKDHDLKYIKVSVGKDYKGENSIDFDVLKILVTNGQFDRKDKDGEVIQNGFVSYPVLRRMVSNADCESKTEIAELLSLMDKTKNGGKPVDVIEISVAVKNGALSVDDIAKNCGFVVRNAEDVENAKIVENMKKKLGDKPEEKLDAILAENAANAEAIVKNKVVAVYGQSKTKNGDVEADNPAYVYAIDKCKGKNSTEVDAILLALKDDSVMKMIASKNADMDTTAIVIGGNASIGVSKNNIDGIPVIGGK